MEIRRFGYYWLDTWVLANVIQLATQNFCMHYLNRTNDPLRPPIRPNDAGSKVCARKYCGRQFASFHI